MPRQETVLAVFVASPSDVAAERQALAQAISELNATWLRTLGIRLELISWETAVHPDVGADPQDVINRQIPNDYDVFIGIMWSRFGVPTGRAGSGTEEEFTRALDRHRRAPGSVTLMFYFSDAPLSPTQIDAGQLQRVNDFRGRISTEGVLFGTFASTDAFEALLRLHLSRVVQEWRQAHPDRSPCESYSPQEPALQVSAHDQASADAAVDEVGFLDLVEEATNTLQEGIAAGERLTAALQDLAANVERRAQEMQRANAEEGSSNFRLFKRAANAAAEDMDLFVKRTHIDLPTLARSYEEGVRLTGAAAGIGLEFGNRQVFVEQLTQLANIFDEHAKIFLDNLSSTRDLRAVVDSTPRITTAYNRSKKAMLKALDDLISQFEAAIGLAEEAAATMRALLADAPKAT